MTSDPGTAHSLDRRGLKALVHRYLEGSPTTPGPRWVQMGIMGVIIVSVAAMVVETLQVEVAGSWIPLSERLPALFSWLEWGAVAIFTAEYLLRLWSITVDPRYRKPFRGRLAYALKPMTLVDLLAVLPCYFQAGGFIAARSLRLLRVFRIFKLGHYSKAVRLFQEVMAEKKADLLVTTFLIAILLVLASTIVFYAENDAQPDKYSSIPASMWWAVVTLTTVGYGDISPVTPMGKLAGGVISILGIGIVALPAAIIGSAYIARIDRRPVAPGTSGAAGDPGDVSDRARCPHCGKGL